MIHSDVFRRVTNPEIVINCSRIIVVGHARFSANEIRTFYRYLFYSVYSTIFISLEINVQSRERFLFGEFMFDICV